MATERGGIMIDENKLIDVLREIRNKRADNKREYELMSDFINIVDNQPKVNEWISVKNKLPTKSNSYLVTKICKNDYEDENLYKVCSEIFWTRDNKWDCERDEYCEWKVIAWRPLPSRYEG